MEVADRRVVIVDPLHPPDWRWRTACDIHERFVFHRRRKRKSDPEWLEPLLALFETINPSGRPRRRWSSLRSSVSPELLSAHQLYLNDTPTCWELEARVLAGQSDNDIAWSMSVAPAVVSAFEEHFFQVRDHLAASDYILFDVIGYDPFGGFQDGDLRGLWQFFGYQAGPKMLELVIAVSQDKPLPDWVLKESPDPAAAEQLRTFAKLAILASTRSCCDLRRLLTLQLQVLELRRKSSASATLILENVPGFDDCFGLANLLVSQDGPNSTTSQPDSAGPDPLEWMPAAVA